MNPFAKKISKNSTNIIASNLQMTTNGNLDFDLTALTERLNSIIRVVRNTAAQGDQLTAESRSDRSDSTDINTIATANSELDSNVAVSDHTESKSSAIAELRLEEPPSDEDRNKR